MILQRFPSYLVHLMMSTVGLFHIFLFTSCLYYSDSQTFSFCTDKNDGDPCLLSCHTSDVDKDITISKSPMFSVALGTCVSGDQCYTSDGSLYNVTQSGFTTNLEILSFSKSDNATWRCEYTGNPVHDKFLTWSKLPQSITELAGLTSNVTITDDLTISVEVGCLYSIQVPTTKLQLMCGGTLVTSYEMTSYTSNTVCSDPDLSAYICNYTITSNPPARSCNSGFTGYSLKAVVNLHGTTKTYASNISETYRVSFESPSDGGNDSYSWLIYLIIIIILVIILVLLILYCCLYNTRLGSRYLRINSKKRFCWPKKNILFIDDKTENIKLEVGEEIEIQCLRGGKGNFVIEHPSVSETEKIKKTPFVLRNPCMKINDLKKKHEGEYRYESEQNDVIKGCLNLKVHEDMYCISITKSVSVYWANTGESLRLQLIDDSMTVCWFKTNSKDKKVTRIYSSPKKTSIVLKNISYEDEGSYHATNTRETWKSGSLELKIVNDLVKIGNVDVTHVTTKGSSLKLVYTERSVLEIKSLTWKSSRGNSRTTLSENTLKNEKILNNIGTEDEGHYWCEGTCSNLNPFKSGTLSVKVVDVLVNVGECDLDSVCLKGQSVFLQYKCEQQNIKKAVWKKSPRSDSEEDMSTLELILKQLTKQDQGKYYCKVTYREGTETKSEKSGAVKLKIVDSIFQVEMKSVQCSATIGDSIEIRCTNEIDPRCIIFSVKVKSKQQIAPVSTKTDGSTLLIENISQEHDGYYHFESVDGKKETGVLKLSVIDGTERSNAVYIAKGKPLRTGNDSYLQDSLTQIANNQD